MAESGGELEELLNPDFPPEQMQLIADVQNRTDAISRAAAEEALEPLTQQPMTPAEVNHARRQHNLPLDSGAETEQPAQPKQEPMNFRITDDDLGAGGPKTKYKANVEAIRVLQILDAEQRQATAEEQEILSRYVGWGGIPQAFDENNAEWSKEYAELQSLLTADEYKEARASTLNAFYTSPTVIKAMYEALGNMGLSKGNVLEPSCGVGNFMGLVPDSMEKIRMYGVELDSISGRIAQQLYQKNKIAVQGFETMQFPDSFFDCVVGNVPFGNYKVPDKRYDRHNFLIHDYFIAKSLDLVRPGGVVAMVTSSGTMDKKDSSVREYLANRADLVGAVRLPNNAFQRNANTGVVTKETEAESIAFTVCSALGIDTSDYSFPYVASWASGKELKELKDEYARPDAALTVISREQALRLFDEGKQIYLIRVSPWPVLVTGREEIERGSDYFQIAQEDLEKDKQKAMEKSEKTPVEKLAADLDNFAFDFDFYHYKDSVEDREQAVEALKEQIQAGDIQPIWEWLQVAVEESEGESAEKAAELITRLDALVKEQKLLSGSEKQFGIYQITARDPEHDYRFMNLDFVKRHGMEVNRADYELVYTEPLTEKDTLEAIYERFNIQRPTDFTGHSLSVSDVVVLNDGKSIKACYVDSIGFAELPDFFKERKMDLKKETILDEQLQEIEIFDKPGLFSNSRLRDEDVPDGLYRYDLRGSDYDPGQPILVEKTVIVNHAASVLMAEELDLGAGGRLELGEEGLNFTGGLLTVREFMEEQEHKKDGLIHGDSDQIAVEGHVGTWYAIDETEVGGEKFFLLEHEEYGDEAACVAVNEQGKLVAEDLWNGFDEDFQDAVKEYFAEKNPTSQKEEQAVPVAEESRTDNSDVPVYYESFAYAAENGEVDLYRISRQLNEDCRNAIEEAIADNFDGMHLADDATKSVVEQFGMERMGYILAYTLNYNNHDGRYSHSNKEWAETTCKGERGNNIRPDWIVRSHPAVLNGFVDMYRKELEAEQQREPEKSFVQQFYVVTDLQTNPMRIEKFGDLDDAMSCYQQVPNFHLKALGVEKTPDPLPGSLDIVQCKNGIDTIVEDYKKVPGWDNPYIQNHVVALVAEALKVQDVAVAYEINDGYFHIQTSEDGYDYTLYSKDFTVMDGGIVETDEYRPVQEVMEEVLAEHGHSVSECGVISAEYLQEQSYRAETQRAEAMKEKLAAEKPAPEASISFYVAECAEFPVMGEFHDNLTLEQALEVYDKIPAERMKGIKSIGFSLEDGSIYSGMFDLMVGGEVQAEIVNHIQHYRESPLVQKAISDMKTLLEKRQASKELEERPSTRQSVREALKNRKKAQEQQSNQEQEKPKKAKKKGEMEL